MTKLSDAELSNEIYDLVNKHWTLGGELAVAVRALITAEILAAAAIDEDEMVEAMAEVAWAARGWAFGEQMDHVKQTARAEMRAALTAITPTLARLAAENQRMRDALGYFLTDDRFQVAVGGNPIIVEAMLRTARAALGDQP